VLNTRQALMVDVTTLSVLTSSVEERHRTEGNKNPSCVVRTNRKRKNDQNKKVPF
jgi:hypothetical protein